MVKIEFKFKGVEFFGYIKDLSPEVFGSITSYTKVIYKNNNTSEILKGFWKHGRTGTKKYLEPVLYNIMTQKVELVYSYHSGSLRQDIKYLLEIMENRKS